MHKPNTLNLDTIFFKKYIKIVVSDNTLSSRKMLKIPCIAEALGRTATQKIWLAAHPEPMEAVVCMMVQA
jgi:hypothetical protein